MSDAKIPPISATSAAAQAILQAAPAQVNGHAHNVVRSCIQIKGGNLSEATDEAEAALVASGVDIYQRGDALVRPVIEKMEASGGRQAEVGQLIAVGKYYLRDALCRASDFERFDKRSKDWVQVNPPMEVAETLLARNGEWAFKPISGVISAPTLRPDGSLLNAPGYDAATRLYLIDTDLATVEVPAQPTMEQASEAATLLADLLEEFPFADAVAKSVAMSALITPVVRGAFPVAPMHATRAPQAGTGKSFLLDVAAAIAMGQPCPIMAAGKNPEETEKRLVGALLNGQPIISIDNTTLPLSGDILCQAVERPVLTLRTLGRSDMLRLETRTTFFASGNNLAFADDMTRRGLICQLDSGLERPEQRQFTANPFRVVLQSRAKYVAAALTVCRAYIVTGRPNLPAPLASFEGWSDTVRAALIWLGYADPLDAMERAKAEDPVRQATEAVYIAIRETLGAGFENRFTSLTLASLAEARHELFHGRGEVKHPELHAAVMAIAGIRGSVDTRRLGKWFQQMKDRIVAGMRLSCDVDPKKGNRWYLDTQENSLSPLSPTIPPTFPHDESELDFNELD